MIESHFTTRERRSNRARPVPERAILVDESHRVQAYLLRGYVFFGSVSPLADRLRKSLSGTSRPDCLLLDFGAVSGFDFSAVNVLGRLLQDAGNAGVQVVLSALPEPLRAGLQRSVPPQTFAGLLLEPNADLALERCEDTVIAAWKESASLTDRDRAALLEQTADDLERQLERQIDFENLMEELGGLMDARTHDVGETLADAQTQREGLQLLLSGRVSVCDRAGVRLYQRGPGDVVPPVGAKDETVATVVADEPCRTMVLTQASRDWLESNRQELALKLYRYLSTEHFQVDPGR